MKIRILACLFAILTLFGTAACADKDDFRDDLTALQLAESIRSAIPEESGWVMDDSGFTEEYFSLPDSVTEHTVYYAKDTNNIDEFGIYHITEGGTREIEAMVMEKYLEASYLKNREWYDSYIPTETPKLRNAEVRTFGNYVVYAIMSEENKEKLFDTVEDRLEK